jgi:N-methylhydantoinase A
MLKIGIDTGGTFTDFIIQDGKTFHILKLISTPSNPALAILEGLRCLAPQETYEILHGSTVGTNALLERKGAKTALITTEGFEDVLEIGRQNRPKIYSLFPSRPAPLVPADRRFGIRERVLHDGAVLIALDRRGLSLLEKKLRSSGTESLAVCLLFSYANPSHEKAIERALRGLQIPISLSHVILPEYREYERTSTTVVNAYLAPIMGRYLAGLEKGIARKPKSSSPRLRIMQSNGGAVSARLAIREPVRTILSGPAGGVVGAWEMARLAGFERILTFDMGGTSTDVSLCDGEIRVTSESVVAQCPVGVPVIDIHTVGAGGGSIARVDEGGALRVGPESAGADPGPICYGKGDCITVTDANLFLGMLDQQYPLGGTLYLQDEKLDAAFRSLAAQMGIRSAAAAAQGVIDIANANMEAALRVISVERGHDPRDFTLVTFGGAGGLHAAALAASLSIPRVLVPAYPGLLSALGVLLSDTIKDFSRTVMLPAGSENRSSVQRVFRELESDGRAAMREEGFAASRTRLERWVDMRYCGQSFEISLPCSGRFEADFHRLHEQRYGYADPNRKAEIVTLRVRARGLAEKPRLRKQKIAGPDPAAALLGEKSAAIRGKKLRTRMYERANLRAGNRIEGPALIFEYSASTVVPPGYTCVVDAYTNLILTSKALRIVPNKP